MKKLIFVAAFSAVTLAACGANPGEGAVVPPGTTTCAPANTQAQVVYASDGTIAIAVSSNVQGYELVFNGDPSSDYLVTVNLPPDGSSSTSISSPWYEEANYPTYPYVTGDSIQIEDPNSTCPSIKVSGVISGQNIKRS